MRTASIILILFHFNLIVEPVFALAQQQQGEMTVTLVKQSNLIGSKGSRHGVSVGMMYEIYRGGTIIGRAEVRVVRPDMCGLKISEMNPGYTPRLGDRLVSLDSLTPEQDDIFAQMQNSRFSPDKLTRPDEVLYDGESPSDFYYDGQASADNDYGSAFAGGFLAGILGGLIGWGIGYAVVSSQGATVPPRYVTRMNADERVQFSLGYKEKIKSKRKSTFHKGALTGTLIVVALVLVSYNSQ